VKHYINPYKPSLGSSKKRQTLPILSNVLLTVDDSNTQQLSITGTDLEVELVGHCQLKQPTKQPGMITVPGRKLLDICRSLPDQAEIEITVKDNRVHIRSGRSRFTLSTLPANDFPSIKGFDKRIDFPIEQKSLKMLVQRTHFAMAQQDVRYYLNGMLFELNDGSMRTVATDGHRLALNTIDSSVINNDITQVIVPRKGISELMRLIEDNDQEVSVRVGENHIQVQGGDFIFTSKLIDGSFPDYDRVIPKDGNKSIIIDRDGLKDALTRVAILCNEKFRGIRVQLQPGSLTLTANNPEQEEAEETLSIDYQAEDLSIGFNVNYILDILNTIDTDQLKMTFSDADSSVLFEELNSDGNSLFVIMPMRL